MVPFHNFDVIKAATVDTKQNFGVWKNSNLISQNETKNLFYNSVLVYELNHHH